MWQQIIALVLIIIFITRLNLLRKKNKIQKNEYIFWMIFWGLAGLAILFLKQLDTLLIDFGFSGSGINFLLYLAVLFLFYLIFRLRLKILDLDTKITKLLRELALKDDHNTPKEK
ncbi:MAG TPA: DUF2304 domain-containing protein [Patescibacteria group bacterium]|nr:DUF2304 domain-containing protein [Patescibacteria group bacterium]